MGGAAGISLVLGMVRTKFAALLIGTGGVGLLSGFGAIQGLVGAFAGLGIQSSAVRQVAVAAGNDDLQAVARTALMIRRLCWLTGLAGLVAMIVLGRLVSELTFGDDRYSAEVAALGVIVLLGNLASGQMALIQGVRHIEDMARINILGVGAATVFAIGLYATMGTSGIVPAMAAAAAVHLLASWYYARRIRLPAVSQSWWGSLRDAGDTVRLGLVFMWNGVLATAVTYLAVAQVNRDLGLEAVGLYSAAFSLSGVFVNFVLNAMGADYFPRLAAVQHDRGAANGLVNEQTEIALLLAVPGLVATMALAPWMIRVFYTNEFLAAVEVLQWFVLGCWGRVVSWPLGYLMVALGRGRWFLATETMAHLLHIALIAAGLKYFGLVGVAIAFAALYVAYTTAVFMVASRLTAFRWSADSVRIAAVGLTLLAVTFVSSQVLKLWAATAFGLLSSALAAVYCLRLLIGKVGADHRISRAAGRIPIVRQIIRW